MKTLDNLELLEVSVGPALQAKTAYYAHCLSIYDTPAEERDLELIAALGFVPINPNEPEVQRRCDALREEFGAAEPTGERKNVMYEIFRPMVQACDILVFRALPDGSISSGAFKEIEYAQEAQIPVIELPSNISRRRLTLAQTREYLREVGQR